MAETRYFDYLTPTSYSTSIH